jgi:hypothetical protein
MLYLGIDQHARQLTILLCDERCLAGPAAIVGRREEFVVDSLP